MLSSHGITPLAIALWQRYSQRIWEMLKSGFTVISQIVMPDYSGK
jgi:hypothetical protein